MRRRCDHCDQQPVDDRPAQESHNYASDDHDHAVPTNVIIWPYQMSMKRGRRCSNLYLIGRRR